MKCVCRVCRAMWKTPDLRVRPTGSASGGAPAPRYGQLAGRSVFNTPSPFSLAFFFGESSLLGMNYSTRDGVCSTQRPLRRLTALPPRQQDRAGEPADRSRDMLKLVRPCRPSLASTCREGGKRKEHPPSPGSPVRSRPAPPGQGTANGRGFAVRGTSGRSIRP